MFLIPFERQLTIMSFNRIVITGGAGFIGSHVVDVAVERFPEATILVFDKMNYASNVNNIIDHIRQNRVRLMVGDIADINFASAVIGGADLVINLAAESHVGRSFGNSIDFSRTNTLGTHVLLEAARRHKTKCFVHVSTDEVYGEVLEGAASESSPLHPNNPYSGSKAAAEMIVQSYRWSFGMPVLTVRANNIFGIRQFPEKIVPKFLVRGLENGIMMLHGDGSHRRHYLNVADFAAALFLIVQHGKGGDIFNVGSDEEYTNLEVANMICRTLSLDPAKHIGFERDRPFNDRRYAVDYSKIARLGWKPTRRLSDELRAMAEWYKANRSLFPEDLDWDNHEAPA